MVRTIAFAICAVCLGCGRFGFDDEQPADACAVTVTPSVQRANLHSEAVFTASGGRPPYEFTLVSGPGTVSVDGQFVAADQPGVATVQAVDSFGCAAQTTLDVGGDSLFYVGGASNAVPSAQVLRSDDGLTWTTVGMLPGPRTTGALLVLRDTMFWISGTNVSAERDVFASSDGATWTKVGDVPVAATSFGNTVFGGAMMMAGGNGNAGNVVRSTDGVTWTNVGSLPMDNHGGTLNVLGGNLLYAGGHNGSLFDWVLSSPTGAAWTQVGTLPMGREYHRAIVVAGTLYFVGGQDTNPTPLPLVTSTTDGVAFTPDPDLPAGRPFGSLALWRGELWSVGGSDGGGVWTSTPGGAWTQRTTNFPAPRQGGGLVAFTPH